MLIQILNDGKILLKYPTKFEIQWSNPSESQKVFDKFISQLHKTQLVNVQVMSVLTSKLELINTLPDPFVSQSQQEAELKKIKDSDSFYFYVYKNVGKRATDFYQNNDCNFYIDTSLSRDFNTEQPVAYKNGTYAKDSFELIRLAKEDFHLYYQNESVESKRTLVVKLHTRALLKYLKNSENETYQEIIKLFEHQLLEHSIAVPDKVAGINKV